MFSRSSAASTGTPYVPSGFFPTAGLSGVSEVGSPSVGASSEHAPAGHASVVADELSRGAHTAMEIAENPVSGTVNAVSKMFHLGSKRPHLSI